MSVVADSVFDHALVRAAGLRLQSSDSRRAQLMHALDKPEMGFRSPLVRLWDFTGSAEVESGGLIRVFTEAERAELIFIFTRPIEECLATLAAGRSAFRIVAETAVDQALPEILIEELFRAVMECIIRRQDKPEILPL